MSTSDDLGLNMFDFPRLDLAYAVPVVSPHAVV